MKYYSEILKKHFDTEEQCLAAEEKVRQEKEERTTTKAKLAKEIEDADKALDVAYEEVDKAKKDVAELQKEFDKKVDELMNPTLSKVYECLNKRRTLIDTFNHKFGVYTTTYTGNDALNEFLKMERRMNSILDNPFIW